MVKQGSQTLKNSHGGYGGRTLIQRIEAQMDKRRKKIEDSIIKWGLAPMGEGLKEQMLQRGRYEGLAAALAILRTSSVPEEVSRSNDRLGIE